METTHFSVITFVSLFCMCLHVSIACNEAVCASVVSKCMLTQSCKCDPQNATCLRDCFHCLNTLYDECCSCVDMCPKQKEDDSLSTKSHVENFPDPIPELFRALTAGEDPAGRWQAYTVLHSYDDHKYNYKQEKHIKLITAMTTNEQEVDPQKAGNCTVAYLKQCMTWKKCKQSCLTMGASKYRWFHDSCCECIGSDCIGYGSDQSSCSNCPQLKDDLDVDKANFYYDDGTEYTVDGSSVKQQVAENSDI